MEVQEDKQLTIKSVAFKDNGFIPEKYTCDGDDVNPFLEISRVPKESTSLCLIVDDADAPSGTWTHWLVWDIDPKTRYIEEDSVPQGAKQGTTSFKEIKYGGPCPGKEHGAHKYRFTLYALNKKLNLKDGASRVELEQAMEGGILESVTLSGLYKRA